MSRRTSGFHGNKHTSAHFSTLTTVGRVWRTSGTARGPGRNRTGIGISCCRTPNTCLGGTCPVFVSPGKGTGVDNRGEQNEHGRTERTRKTPGNNMEITWKLSFLKVENLEIFKFKITHILKNLKYSLFISRAVFTRNIVLKKLRETCKNHLDQVST